MAITIYEDLVEGTNYREDDRTGSFTRPYRVSGLTSSNRITTDSLYAADGARSVPRAGDVHPSMPDFRVRAVEVVPIPRSRTDVRLLVYYVKTRRRLLDVRLSGIGVNTTTDKDKDGKLLLVGYLPPPTLGGKSTPPETVPPPPGGARGGGPVDWQYDYGRVPILLCETTLEIEYLEKESPEATGERQMENFVMTVNKNPWQGAGARRWLCETYTGRIDSPIPTNLAALGQQEVVTGEAKFDWIVMRRFRKLPAPPKGPGWDPLLIFVDRSTGIQPTDIDPLVGGYLKKTRDQIYKDEAQGNGWKIVPIYGESDFDKLNLVSAVK